MSTTFSAPFSLRNGCFCDLTNVFRDQLVKDITSRGGFVLTSVPADGNDSRDEVVSVVPQGPGGHSGAGQRKGCVIVISHPKEFRKPNYLLALATGEWHCGLRRIGHAARKFPHSVQCLLGCAVLRNPAVLRTAQHCSGTGAAIVANTCLFDHTGVALVHYQWVRDSVEHSQLQPLAPYLLPSGCSSLHGYSLFPQRTGPVEALISLPGRGGALVPTQDSTAPEPVLTNVKVLNFAGG
jgi:hypothetical protein